MTAWPVGHEKEAARTSFGFPIFAFEFALPLTNLAPDMPGHCRPLPLKHLCAPVLLLLGLLGCSSSQAPTRPATATPAARPAPAAPVVVTTAPAAPVYPVMLGIDVLESEGFASLRGKRVGLLTHPAGVNRRGESTIDVLRRAPGVKLVALYAVEHGLYNELPAETTFPDKVEQWLGAADVFLLVEAKLKEGVFMPSKLADYLAAGKPILALSPRVGTVADYLKDGGGLVVEPDDVAGIAAALEQLLDLWQAGRLATLRPPAATIARVSPEQVVPLYEQALAVCRG